jgi:hypothetical protein
MGTYDQYPIHTEPDAEMIAVVRDGQREVQRVPLTGSLESSLSTFILFFNITFAAGGLFDRPSVDSAV